MAPNDSPLAATHPRRIAARAIDVAIALLLSLPMFPIGWILGSIYVALGDCLQKGTFGNRRTGLRVVSRDNGARLGRKQSFFRNLAWLFVVCAYQLPMWGGQIAFYCALALVLTETYVILRFRVRDGLDNLMGDAQVIAAGGAVGATR